MEQTSCFLCARPFSQSQLKSKAYGPIELACKHRVHPACAVDILGPHGGGCCPCIEANDEIMGMEEQQAVVIDLGDAMAIQTQACQELAKERARAVQQKRNESLWQKQREKWFGKKQSETKAATQKDSYQMETYVNEGSKTHQLEPIVHNNTVVCTRNLAALIQTGVPLSILDQKEITMSDLQRQGITLDDMLAFYSLGEFYSRIDSDKPWDQLIAMGLKWQHLKNKTKMPPDIIGKHLRPTAVDFLNLFANAPGETTNYLELSENDSAFTRFLSIDYTPREMAAVGIQPRHLVDVLMASHPNVWDLSKMSGEEWVEAHNFQREMEAVNTKREKNLVLNL